MIPDCPYCGSTLNLNSNFCNACGRPIGHLLPTTPNLNTPQLNIPQQGTRHFRLTHKFVIVCVIAAIVVGSLVGLFTQVGKGRINSTKTPLVSSTLGATSTSSSNNEAPTPTATPSPTPTFTPTATPTPTVTTGVIYQADFKNRQDEWPGAKFIDGLMVFSTSDSMQLNAPISLSSPDYEVVVTIKYISGDADCGGVGVFARMTSNNNQYLGTQDVCNGQFAAITTCLGNNFCGIGNAYGFIPRQGQIFTLALKVKGTQVSLLLNGATVVPPQDSTVANDPGTAGIISASTSAEILAFKIITL